MDSPINGSLSYRPSVTAAECAIDFVYTHLPLWRDHPARMVIESENGLTESLANYLADEARRENQPFTFSHQSLAGGHRTVDFSARRYDGAVNSFALPAITVFEAKRLPTPGTRREMEYVIGVEKPYGGIQRFKFGKKGHGTGHPLVAMIGYVQKGAPDVWFSTINSWIVGLSKRKPNGDLLWRQSEKLTKLQQNQEAHTACAVSTHNRCDESDIVIRHLWVIMNIES